MKKRYQWLRRLYHLSVVIRKTVLASQFGYVSQCRHYPTCGSYALSEIETNGFLIGTVRGLKRISGCLLLPHHVHRVSSKTTVVSNGVMT